MSTGSLLPSVQRSWNLFESGCLAEAESTLLEAHSSQPLETAEELELLGLIRHDQGRSDEAIKAIERAQKLDQVGDRAKIALASCYADRGRTDLAREQFLQLAISRELSPALMLEVAAGLASIDAVQMAIQVCQWAIDRDESNAQAYFDMGRYSARLGRPTYVCEALIQRALQLSPENVHFRIGLASLLIQLSQPSAALTTIRTLRADQIESASCASCLSSIASLLRDHDQVELAGLCERRAAELFEAKRNISRKDSSKRGFDR